MLMLLAMCSTGELAYRLLLQRAFVFYLILWYEPVQGAHTWDTACICWFCIDCYARTKLHLVYSHSTERALGRIGCVPTPAVSRRIASFMFFDICPRGFYLLWAMVEPLFLPFLVVDMLLEDPSCQRRQFLLKWAPSTGRVSHIYLSLWNIPQNLSTCSLICSQPVLSHYLETGKFWRQRDSSCKCHHFSAKFLRFSGRKGWSILWNPQHSCSFTSKFLCSASEYRSQVVCVILVLFLSPLPNLW